MPGINEINDFLFKVRLAIKNNRFKILDARTKYTSTLGQLGIKQKDVLEDIAVLTAKEFCKKIMDNNPNYPGYVWVWKKYLHGESIYIKLKIKELKNEPSGFLLIMSYHIDGM